MQLPSLHTYSRPTPPVSLMDCLSWDFPPTKPPRLASPCLSSLQDLHIPTAAVYQGLSLSLGKSICWRRRGLKGGWGEAPLFRYKPLPSSKKALPFLLSNVLCALRGRNEGEDVSVCVAPSSIPRWSKGGGERPFPNAHPEKSSSRQLFSHTCMRVCIRIYPFSLLSHLSCHSWQRQKGSLLLLLLFSLHRSSLAQKRKEEGFIIDRGYSGFGKDTFCVLKISSRQQKKPLLLKIGSFFHLIFRGESFPETCGP